MYDNAGRTTERIRSYDTGEPTHDDLLRMGLARVRSRTTQGGEPPAPGRSVLDWTEALAGCESPGDLAAVIHHVCCTDDAALARLHQFLEEAAERVRQIPGAAHVAGVIEAQTRALGEIGDRLDEVGVDLVDADRTATPPEPDAARAQAAQSASPGITDSGIRSASDGGARQSTTAPTPPRRGQR